MDVRIHPFPSRDLAFVELVHSAWRDLPAPRTAEALQRAVRERYPTAVVTPQADLARHGEGPAVWYAFRTAALGLIDPSGRLEALEASPAWAVLDDDRRFLEVSPGLAAIAELPAKRMVGRQVEDFSNPADPSIRDDIARLWAEFLAEGSLRSTLRFNHADGRPRELAYQLMVDADGPGRHRLAVRVIEPEA